MAAIIFERCDEFHAAFLVSENCGMMAVRVKDALDVPVCMIDIYGKEGRVYFMGDREKDQKDHRNLRSKRLLLMEVREAKGA